MSVPQRVGRSGHAASPVRWAPSPTGPLAARERWRVTSQGPIKARVGCVGACRGGAGLACRWRRRGFVADAFGTRCPRPGSRRCAVWKLPLRCACVRYVEGQFYRGRGRGRAAGIRALALQRTTFCLSLSSAHSTHHPTPPLTPIAPQDVCPACRSSKRSPRSSKALEWAIRRRRSTARAVRTCAHLKSPHPSAGPRRLVVQ